MDETRTLETLTPEVVKEAYKEARDGTAISLQWHTKAFEHLLFIEEGEDTNTSTLLSPALWTAWCRLHHDQWMVLSDTTDCADSQASNPRQSGSQDPAAVTPSALRTTCARFVARGVLIDYKTWARQQGRSFNDRGNSVISISDIEAVARAQNVEFTTGDVLMIRSGFVDGINRLPGAEQASLLISSGSCGVESTINAANWIRQNKFSAVAGDMIGFEQISGAHGPDRIHHDGRVEVVEPCILHRELVRRDVPVGELWSMEELADACNERGRYTCLLTFSLSQETAGRTSVIHDGLAML